jgi:hypothetical protein
MLAEFATRLAIALPLVCLMAVATLMAVRRGWFRLPAFATLSSVPRRAVPEAGAAPLSVAAVKSLSPAARVAVVRFQGQELLLGISGPAIVLLASGTLPAIPATPADEPEPRP